MLDPSNQSLVKQRAFKKILTGKTKEGEVKEVVRLENKLTRPKELLFYAALKIQKFVMHNFVAQW
jgi:hypothetical protein